ncbi:hypothetical protein C9I99_21015 [Photobacterium lutimaris]|uniref:Uncharacterized protein n=1 Tax=Photobacterium lutimaris TaxID=388278 RepID=A0A2T3ITK6_9GAMM|nr:hypothetical protein C9I99_21015 [Photobacterium lutimaris]TDR72693.1 hypothetical protein DFP78_113169 [Photobacterium lutimaris]
MSESILLYVSCFSTLGMALTLTRYILFKRELYKLKQQMKKHHLKHGFDDQLWDLFVTRTRKMLSFWR